jgi:hypothetical protein
MQRQQSAAWTVGCSIVLLVACSTSPRSQETGLSAPTDGSMSDGSTSPEGSTPMADGATTTEPSARTFTLKTTSVTIAPGSEVFKCQDFVNPAGQDVAVTSVSSQMTGGPHHLFVFMLPDLTDSDIADCTNGGLEFHDFIHATQAPKVVVNYPRGIGRIVKGNMGYRVNAHLLNASSDPVEAIVDFKATYVRVDTIEHPAYSILLNNTGFRAPIGKSTIEDSFVVPYVIELLSVTSHMHRWGTHFVASTDDGTVLLESSNSQEPSTKTFDPPRELMGGTSIHWACTIDNDTSGVLTYGQSPSMNEMCIFAGFFYAKAGEATELEGS